MKDIAKVKKRNEEISIIIIEHDMTVIKKIADFFHVTPDYFYEYRFISNNYITVIIHYTKVSIPRRLNNI